MPFIVWPASRPVITCCWCDYEVIHCYTASWILIASEIWSYSWVSLGSNCWVKFQLFHCCYWLHVFHIPHWQTSLLPCRYILLACLCYLFIVESAKLAKDPLTQLWKHVSSTQQTLWSFHISQSHAVSHAHGAVICIHWRLMLRAQCLGNWPYLKDAAISSEIPGSDYVVIQMVTQHVWACRFRQWLGIESDPYPIV